jgi:hypothetical protein
MSGRPRVSLGSFASVLRCPPYVRFAGNFRNNRSPSSPVITPAAPCASLNKVACSSLAMVTKIPILRLAARLLDYLVGLFTTLLNLPVASIADVGAAPVTDVSGTIF